VIRETYSKIRFFFCKKNLKQYEVVDGVLHVDYSRTQLLEHPSIRDRINLIVNTLETSTSKLYGELLSI
jgi:hypothetical protein